MKRLYYPLIGGILASLLFVACGGNSNSALKKVTINWWHIDIYDPLKSAWQGYANDYMKAHPNVTIKITVIENTSFKEKLQGVMQAGTPPDIFHSWGGGGMQTYIKAGLIKDLTPYLQSGGWGDSFIQSALSLYKYNGKNYGVPWDIGAVGFWYNKDLFATAGITGTPKTWDDFIGVINKLKAANITPIALGEKDSWTGAFYWEYLAVRLGGQAAFDKAQNHTGGSFTDPPYIQAGDYIKQLVALQPFQPGFLDTTYVDHQALMGNSKAAMELMGQWGPGFDAGAATDKKGPPLGFFPFPSLPNEVGSPTDVLGGANGFCVGKNAPPEAIDFLKFLTSADHQRALAQKGAALPPVKDALSGLADLQMQTVANLAGNANYFQLYYDQYFPDTVGTTINDQTEKLFADITSSHDAAEKIDIGVRQAGT
jgi:raffinose/stachyose/melibiose transport system substrate-binding protein